VTDHHTTDGKKTKALAVIHTTKICGSAVSWFFAREINKSHKDGFLQNLELAAIGTVADQMPLLEINRSIVKFGIKSLRTTKRLGLKNIYESAAIEVDKIGVYEIGFVIAPRINAMGRLGDGMDSLRLLCTTNLARAKDLGQLMHKTNLKRQKIVEEAVIHAQSLAQVSSSKGVLLLVHESYHEGIIGLAASRLVEVYSRPAIVVSRGAKISKGSARSMKGINITDVLRKLDKLMINLGGHEMAAGFSIENKNLEKFGQELERLTSKLITPDLLSKKLAIDMLLGFDQVDWDLVKKLEEFEPSGIANSKPLFATKKVKVVDKKLIGTSKDHIKLKLEQKNRTIDAIAFKMGDLFEQISEFIDLAYNVEINTWNGVESLQLKARDIKIHQN
jgi:single-stranded-DNA-specific exonuclease